MISSSKAAACSWNLVAAGLRMVAKSAAAQTRDDVTYTAARAAQHGVEVAASVRTVLTAVQPLVQSYCTEMQISVMRDDSGMSSRHNNGNGRNGPSKPFTDGRDDNHQVDVAAFQMSSPSLWDKESVSAETSLDPLSAPTPQLGSDNLALELQRQNDPLISSDPQILDRRGARVINTSNESILALENQILAPSSSASSQHHNNFKANSLPNGDEERGRIPEGRAVPSTRFGRALGFANLGLGVAWGTLAEGTSRLLGTAGSDSSSSSSFILNDPNSDRVAATLCRMRGAALKMGQMLSIQDEALLPQSLMRALHKVRQGAEAMPNHQLLQQLESQLGLQWRDRFVRFDSLPFAAASIGQVHRASIVDPKTSMIRDVVVKVQYPGVARSIESDLNNLAMLVKFTGLAPKGLFIENVMRVGQKELQVECDYQRERDNQMRIQAFVKADPVLQENRFVVPDVIEDLTTEQVLTSDFLSGGTIDKLAHSADQAEKDRIGRTILYLTMKEVFDWRFMQTDPNWGNFLYDVNTATTGLIDFGAAREYSKEFVDGYLRIVWASANRDEATLMEQSYKMGFLTGEENTQMLRAHKLSGFTVGEPFWEDKPFDFRGSNISERMGEHTSVFLKHRLTPPPEEVYTLHRKLAGAYMLCIKLGAVVRSRHMLESIVANHQFDEGRNPVTGQ